MMIPRRYAEVREVVSVLEKAGVPYEVELNKHFKIFFCDQTGAKRILTCAATPNGGKRGLDNALSRVRRMLKGGQG